MGVGWCLWCAVRFGVWALGKGGVWRAGCGKVCRCVGVGQGSVPSKGAVGVSWVCCVIGWIVLRCLPRVCPLSFGCFVFG